MKLFPDILIKDVRGRDGPIRAYAWTMFGKNWIIARSSTKWHAGERFTRMPIWLSNFKPGVPAIFIWHIAIGVDNRKPEAKKNTNR